VVFRLPSPPGATVTSSSMVTFLDFPESL
jgi:hypothetical protein